jgi:predicted patatin/cPLA2 family phospholipase
LGLDDTVDEIYGSSAGCLVGAYFVTKQVPYDGPQIYYDMLTTAGKTFVDKKAILRACGLGALDLRPASLRSLATERLGKPVLNLDYVLDNIVRKMKPLNWEKFWEQQQSGKQKLKVRLAYAFIRRYLRFC